MSLLKRDVIPFLLGFAALVAAAIGLDVLLHRLHLPLVGRYLGIAGVALVLATLAPFALRKRQMIGGDPAMWLRLHQTGGWLGALMITVHAGMHVNAILPWLALAVMLVDVASGLAGAFLFRRARAHLEERKAALRARGLSPAEIEQQIFWDALTLDATKKWRMAHSAIAACFTLFAVAHVATVFMFWSWR